MTTKVLALVAEDEPILRMVAADMLEDAGFEVVQVGNAHEALAALENNASMVLLMTDVQMPGTMDGFALAREVARRWPDIAVLVCSGRMSPENGEMPATARFMHKPYTLDTVLSELTQLKLA